MKGLSELETFKTTVRCAVLVFVVGAGAISFAGLDPASKAQAEAIAAETIIEAPSLRSTNEKVFRTKKAVRAEQSARGTEANTTS